MERVNIISSGNNSNSFNKVVHGTAFWARRLKLPHSAEVSVTANPSLTRLHEFTAASQCEYMDQLTELHSTLEVKNGPHRKRSPMESSNWWIAGIRSARLLFKSTLVLRFRWNILHHLDKMWNISGIYFILNWRSNWVLYCSGWNKWEKEKDRLLENVRNPSKKNCLI